MNSGDTFSSINMIQKLAGMSMFNYRKAIIYGNIITDYKGTLVVEGKSNFNLLKQNMTIFINLCLYCTNKI
jgi:hypothetical protein